MSEKRYIIIGGSAGSFKTVTEILDSFPEKFPFAVILVLHRLKHIKEGFVDALKSKTLLPVSEPFDKEDILPGRVYVAPANYHLYIEPDKKFALSTEEVVNHSRPSIDISFSSAAYSLKDKVTGVILSGANSDGAKGLKDIIEYGGCAVVQDPKDSIVRTMPEAALKLSETKNVLTAKEIKEFLLNI